MMNAVPALSRWRTRQLRRPQPAPSSVVAAVVIGWLGLLVHNVADLPDQTLLSPETLWPSVVTAALITLYATGHPRLAGVGLFGWALLNLLGGSLSVLPLPVLPFDPEQTIRHYSFHLLYAVTQVPLLVVSFHLVAGTTRVFVRARPSTEAPETAHPGPPNAADLEPAS